MRTPKEKKLDEDQALFKDAQKALDARLYVEAIDLFKEFIKKYPDSKGYSWAFQRLGESFEGLLEVEYRKRIENGQSESPCPVVQRPCRTIWPSHVSVASRSHLTYAGRRG